MHDIISQLFNLLIRSPQYYTITEHEKDTLCLFSYVTCLRSTEPVKFHTTRKKKNQIEIPVYELMF